MRFARFVSAVIILLLASVPASAADPAPETGENKQNAQETDENANTPAKDETLPEIKVKGNKETKDETADSAKISGKKLRESPAATTFEAISQSEADVYVNSRGSGIHGVASGASGLTMIRGLGGSPNSQILIVEDGVPEYMGLFGHPIPDAYAPFLIDRVVIVKGGDSVLYGSNALGGAIIFESRRRKTEGFAIENDAQIGSYSTVSEAAAFLGKFGGFDAAAAVKYFVTDGHREGAGGKNLIIQTNGGWEPFSGLRLSLRNKIMRLEGADPGTASHPNSGHWFDVLRDNASIALEYKGDRASFEFIPYFNFGRHKIYDGFYSLDYSAGGKAQAEIVIFDSLKALFGASADWVDGSVKNRVTNESESVKGHAGGAFYAQFSWTPVKELNVVAGTREFYDSQYGFVFLYKAGAKYDATENFYARSRITRNFRQPTLRELYLPYPTANPGLKPEYSLNWDFGGGCDFEHFEFSVSGYRTYAKNLIKYFGTYPSTSVINIDEITVWGVEASAKVKKIGPASFTLGANWQDVGRFTKQNPDAKIIFSAEAGQSFGPHYFYASVSGQWVRGLYQNDYERDPLPDVFFMDASLRYKYSFGGGAAVEPYLLLRNVADARYEFVKDYPMPGFNAAFGLRITL